MLKAHMDAIEAHLLATSQIPANAGHALHRGTPREAFIKEYLENHLPSTVAIGTGEIIDATSKPRQQRNQYDIVIYKRSYPKLDFGGGISGFLVESVVATIEVKSNLTQAEFRHALVTARNCKALVQNSITSFRAGYVPPGVLNYVVAYDGPAHMQTVHGWIAPEYHQLGLANASLPLDDNARIGTVAEALDAVFILGRGFVYLDNIPYGFMTGIARTTNPTHKWVFADTTSGSLLLLFMLIQQATSNTQGAWLNPLPYLSSFTLAGLRHGA